MKKTYINPAFEVKEFSSIKILTESGVNGVEAATAAVNGEDVNNVNTLSLANATIVL